MKRTKLEEWVNGITMVTDPCHLCAYNDKNGKVHRENVEMCQTCCWYYPSQFKERKK